MTNSDNIQDILLQAMEIISGSIVKEELNGNEKILWSCKIIDDSNKKNGEYRVTDGSISFYAYSAVTTYEKDEYVAVMIPQGDFKNVKYILQKVSVDGSQLPYTSPLDNYIQITNNLIENFQSKSLTLETTSKTILDLDLSGHYTAKNSKK